MSLRTAFMNLTESQRETIAALGETRSVSHGEAIIRQDETPDAVFVILSGTARVMLKRTDSINIEFTGPLGPGEIFGEMSFVDNHPTSATVMADGDVSYIRFDGMRLREVLDSDLSLAAMFYKTLMQTVAQRLRKANMHIITPTDLE